MKIEKKDPPREYKVGLNKQIEIKDCANVYLEENEQLTFITDSGMEHDFAAKSWGFYATPSINGRLKDQGFSTALVKNSVDKIYLMVVDPKKMKNFENYLQEEKLEVVEWLYLQG